MLLSLLLLSCLPATRSALAQEEEQETKPATAPVLVHTSPAMDAEVRPGAVTITVEFDQHMDTRGMSWVPLDGVEFPKPRGEITWLSPFVCSYVADLQPKTEYGYSVNGGEKQSFTGLTGLPAQVQQVRFSTTGVPTGPQTVPRHERAADVLISELQTHYSYREQRELDWGAWETETRALLAEQHSSADFAAAAVKQLAGLQDLHVWVEIGGKRQGTYAPTVSTNRHPTQALGQLQEVTSISGDVLVARAGDKVGYLLISNWYNSEGETEELALEQALKALKGTDSLIIDVRPNSGGDETLARLLAGHFVKDPVVYARHRSLLPGGGLGEVSERILEPLRPYYSGKIAVLQGQRCMSSNEAFLLMMQQVPGSRSFGETSFGSSGDPQPHDLGNDVTLYMPSWQAMTPEGQTFEGVGLAPDVPVAWTESGPDSVLAAAVEWLSE